MHEQEERLGLEDQEMGVVVGIIVEMLMHAAILDEHDVVRLPIDAPLVMDVVAAPLQNIEYRAVHMTMFLAIGSGRVNFDVCFDRLGDRGGMRTDDVLAINLRASLPRHVA